MMSGLGHEPSVAAAQSSKFLEPANMAILWSSSRPIYGSNYKRSPSLLASLRLDGGYATSPSAPVNRLRRYSEYFGRTSPRLPSNRLQEPDCSSGSQSDVGVRVCEALRERSEQRANRYLAADCNT